MPGQRDARGRRAGGAARITGIVAVVLLAAAGSVIYLLTSHSAAKARTAPLPDKVISVQSVGLVTLTAGPHGGVPTQLQLTPSGLRFAVVPAADLRAGHPMWTADEMEGGSYTFIYIPDGRCLGVSGRGSKATIDLQHCTLGAAQRWVKVGTEITVSKHVYSAYRSMVSKLCLSHPAAGPTTPAGQVALGGCRALPPGQELISFWWSL
jgi:hypothetical protein